MAAIETNTLFLHRFTLMSRAAGARLVLVSTDRVFSGRKGDDPESGTPDAEDVYGRTKLFEEVW